MRFVYCSPWNCEQSVWDAQVPIKPFSNRLKLLPLVREFARVQQSENRLKDSLTFVGEVVDLRGDKSNVSVGYNWRHGISAISVS
jgi:hypothetical protein